MIKNKMLNIFIIVVFITNCFFSVSISADTGFYLVDSYTKDKDIYVRFSQEVLQSNLQQSINMMDSNNQSIQFSVSINAQNTAVITPTHINILEKYKLSIQSTLVSATNVNIDKAYEIDIAFNGFSEDFGTGYSQGDWMYRTIVSSATTNYAHINSLGELLAVDNSGASTYTSSYPPFVYKKNYTAYDYSDATLEFDYKRLDNATANTYNNKFMAYTRFYGLRVSSYVFYSYGYSLNILTDGTSLTLGKSTDTALPSTLITMTGVSCSLNEKYRFKLITNDVETGVNIKVYRATYTGNMLGTYSLICDYTDTSNPIKSGSCAFFSYHAVSANNSHMVDNVSYIPEDTITQVLSKEIHVSPNGNDNASGTISTPLKTLLGAKTAVSLLKNTYPNQPIDVIFHEGTYRFNSSVNFTESDSGTSLGMITYKAANGEKVKFKASKVLDTSTMSVVTNSSLLQRIPENARGKVYSINLQTQGLTSTNILDIDATINTKADVGLFLDDEEQSVSQWPNGDDNYSTFTTVSVGSSNLGSGGVFTYDSDRPDNWGSASDAYVEGYWNYDYIMARRLISSIDTSSNRITLTQGNLTTHPTISKRWKVRHLLEEIDLPGEWYIDRANLILYYYPPYSLANSNLELAYNYDNIIKLTGTDYVNFEGIEFSQACGNAIYATSNADNCVVNRCTFRDIGNTAIKHLNYPYSSTLYGDYDNVEPTAKHVKDVGKNWLIENNIFYNIGNCALLIYGGNLDTFEEGNNVIRNNYFNRNSTKFKTYSGISLYGFANRVENNLFNNSSQGVITHSGAEHRIKYNEINNVTYGSTDAGAIYTGRSILTRRAEIAYNFIKNTLPTNSLLIPHNRAIYYDDGVCEQYAHHNILLNTDQAIAMGGSSLQVNDNTIINALSGIRAADWPFTNQQNKYVRWQNAVSNGMSSIAYSLWNQRYPLILSEAANKDTTSVYCWNLKIKDNFFVNSGNTIESYVANRNGIVNNTYASTFSDFVDEENYDYRIKSNSSILSTRPNLLSESFNINAIGIQFNEFDKTRIVSNTGFNKIYPQNAASGVGNSNIEFTWEYSLGADKYKFVLATDKDFKNIVINEDVYGNTYKIDTLSSDYSKYYWKVYAINETRQLNSSWESEGQAYSFFTQPMENYLFLSDLHFENSFNERVYDINLYKGAQLLLKGDFIKYGSGQNPFVIVVAIYSGNKLIATDVEYCTNNVTQANTTIGSFTIPSDLPENSSVKILKFLNFENLVPVDDVII